MRRYIKLRESFKYFYFLIKNIIKCIAARLAQDKF